LEQCKQPTLAHFEACKSLREVPEGSLIEDIVLEFPSHGKVKAWYHSPAVMLHPGIASEEEATAAFSPGAGWQNKTRRTEAGNGMDNFQQR